MSTVIHLFPRRNGPPPATVAMNAARAAGRIALALASGEPVMVPEADRERRLALCRACENLADGRCNLCGCRVGRMVLDKTRYATEQCPAVPSRWQKWSNA